MTEKKRKSRKSRFNRKTRSVTVVMSNSYHNLKLVEARAEVREVRDEEGNLRFRVDKNAAEAYARARLAEKGFNGSDDPLSCDPNKYDFVGILVAHTDLLNVGRIDWAEEVETQEAVTV